MGNSASTSTLSTQTTGINNEFKEVTIFRDNGEYSLNTMTNGTIITTLNCNDIVVSSVEENSEEQEMETIYSETNITTSQGKDEMMLTITQDNDKENITPETVSNTYNASIVQRINLIETHCISKSPQFIKKWSTFIANVWLMFERSAGLTDTGLGQLKTVELEHRKRNRNGNNITDIVLAFNMEECEKDFAKFMKLLEFAASIQTCKQVKETLKYSFTITLDKKSKRSECNAMKLVTVCGCLGPILAKKGDISLANAHAYMIIVH